MTGQRYAATVKQLLKTLRGHIQEVDIRQLNLPEKGDCIDWLAAHPHDTINDIEKLPLTETVNIQPAQAEVSTQPHFTMNELGVFHHTEENSHWICLPLTVKAF